jgi:hypothetical protein
VVKLVGAIFSSLALAVLGIECHEAAGWSSRRIVRGAVKRLPTRLRALREEEWLAELDAFEGLRILKLFWSIGIYVAAVRLHFRYSERGWREYFIPPLSAPPPPGTIIALRRHPATLLSWGFAFVACAIACLGATISTIFGGVSAYCLCLWLPCFLLALCLRRRVWSWTEWVWAVDGEQFILLKSHGCVPAAFPRASIADIRAEHSFFARLLGFGTLIFECSDRKFYIPCMPMPDHLMEDLRLWLCYGSGAFEPA